jgi:hypothetical protein
MRIYVADEQIDTSCRRDSHHCMIADSVKVAIPEAQYILVDVQSIRYTIASQQIRYCHLTPLRVQRAIIAFDRGKKVEPFSFELPPVFSTRPAGWVGQANRKATKRRKYPTTGRKRLVVAYRERAFGLRNIPE